MFVNTSSSLSLTPDPPPLSSSNSSISSMYLECMEVTASNLVFAVYFLITLLLLPLYVLILYMGFQRWRRPHSAGQSTSHSDYFAYHIVTVEIVGIFGSVFYISGFFTYRMTVFLLGLFLSCIIFPGQTLFHLLTCVEHYLAVVHPVTYMRLRETGGVRIRNISIVCVWLLCFGWMGVTKWFFPGFPAVPLLCMLGVSVVLIFFCCLSVLWVLTRSGPGEVGGNKERVDQSKQRAFHIICAIMGLLLLRFVGLLVCFGLSSLQSIRKEDLCVLMDLGIFLSLPSSLVLPLLFLHKTGKLACCGKKLRIKMRGQGNSEPT